MTGETRFGVCTLRAELQPEHLLITITTSRALQSSAQRTFISRPKTVVSVRDALAITEQFLRSFAIWEDPPEERGSGARTESAGHA